MFPERIVQELLSSKEKGAIIMKDGWGCEVIDTWTVKVTKRDGMMRALEESQ